jgi:hypothetical protein
MQPKHFLKAGILTLALILGFVILWELFWRSKGFPVAYNDDEALWAGERAKVYQPIDEATVFIGSSRIKFDLDIPTWQKMTGEEAVQLSMVGTNPRPLLHNLADDINFKGKLIIDITEPLFFSPQPAREKSARDGIAFYEDYTPTEKFSSHLNYGLESQIVFLEKERFGLNALLKDLEIPNREGVRERPVFPKEFGLTKRNRQDYMMDKFLNDSSLIKRQTNAWTKTGSLSRAPGVSGDTLMQIFNQVKTSVDKIRNRGGQVIFVRTPSSGGYIETENFVYPRDKYWQALLQHTNSDGIHFKDYSVIANMICPEWSHLSSKDAIIYTKELVRILQHEKGWVFKNEQKMLSKK